MRASCSSATPATEMGLAREAIPFLLITGLPALLAGLYAWEAPGPVPVSAFALLLVFTAFIAFFFRDPERFSPAVDSAVLASGDGRVVAIDRVEDDWVGSAIQISVFLSIFNVHVNRTPCDGRVDRVDYIPGRFHLAFVDKASGDNERTEISLETSGGRVKFKQIAGFVARRIVCRLQPNQQVEAGERFGLIRFGSRIDHVLPTNAAVRVRLGDRVRAGETVIGVLS